MEETNLESNQMTLESHLRALASPSGGIEEHPYPIELKSGSDGIGIPSEQTWLSNRDCS